MQADYATVADQAAVVQTGSATSSGTGLTVTPRAVSSRPRDAHGNVFEGSRDGGLSSYLPPTEQYARTQRNWSAVSLGLDVHA